MSNEDVEGRDGHEVKQSEQHVSQGVLYTKKAMFNVVVVSLISLSIGKLIVSVRTVEHDQPQSHDERRMCVMKDEKG